MLFQYLVQKWRTKVLSMSSTEVDDMFFQYLVQRWRTYVLPILP